MARRDPRRDEAVEHVRKNRLNKAIDLYRAILADSDDPDMRAELGEVYMRAKNTERAFHHYTKAAQMFQQKSEHKKAYQLLAAASQISPNSLDLLMRMAECLEPLKLAGELEKVLRQILDATEPRDRRHTYALEKLGALHPEDLKLASRRAEIFAQTGQIDQAIEAYKDLANRVAHRPPDLIRVVQRAAAVAGRERVDTGVELSRMLIKHRRPNEALSLLLPYYEAAPNNIGVLEVQVEATEMLGSAEAFIPALMELIRARVKLNQRDPTLAEIQKLVDLAPEDPGALETAAGAYYVLEEMGFAANMYRQLFYLYQAHDMTEERDRALMSLIRVAPEDEEALDIAVHLFKDEGKTREADAYAEQLQKLRAAKKSGKKAPAKGLDPRLALKTGSRSGVAHETEGEIELVLDDD